MRPPTIIVTIESWNKLTDKALRFALSISADVMAVHFTQLAGVEGEAGLRLKHGGPSLILMRVPWYLDPVAPARDRAMEAQPTRPSLR